jgi:hypothetical protein
MNDLVKSYTNDVNFLLTEICFTAAMHGLDHSVKAIADHLVDMPRTEGAALLAMSLSKTAVRDYRQAMTFCDRVLENPQMVALHAEATAFRALAKQLSLGQSPSELKLAS